MSIKDQLAQIGIILCDDVNKLGERLLIKDGVELGYFSAMDAFNKFVKPLK